MAEYSIPLWAPPGINGLAPHLALAYASNGADSGLGIGWSISGLSMISRCARTLAQDGAPGPVELSLADRFCLDGQRLRLTAGTYGAPGSTYQTEIDTYARVTAMNAAGQGPASFRVELRDGLILEYGNTADSRIEAGGGSTSTVVTWALNRISDRAGNSVVLAYMKDTANHTYRISNIDYPLLATGGGPYYRIQFVFEPRSPADVRTQFVAGYPVTETQRLARIDEYWSSTGWQLVRRYALQYEDAPATQRTRLASIQECSAEDCFAPTTVSYQSGSLGLLAGASTGQDASDGFTLALDVNGDGMEDIAYANPSTHTLWIMLANGAGFASPHDTGISSVNDRQAFTFDYNADGLADVLIPNASNQWRVLVSTGTSFNVVDTSLPATGAGGNAWVADVNGDGFPDLLWTLYGALYGRFNTGGGFSPTVTTLYRLPDIYESFTLDGLVTFGPPSSRYLSDVRKADFNGDGRTDLVIRYGSDTTYGEGPNYRFYYRVLISQGTHYELGAQLPEAGYDAPIVADLNGDGFSDVIADNKKVWRVWLGTGGSTLVRSAVSVPYGSHQNAAWAMDWDADGRTDLIVRNGTQYLWYRWNGSGFDAAAATGVTEPSTSLQLHGQIRIVDVNGDGLSDWSYVDGTRIKFALHAGPWPDAAQTISDGFGVSASFAYAPISDGTVYRRGSGARFPVRELQSSLHVVRELAQTDASGTGSRTTQRFSYEGARLHQQGRGFLGFAKRTTLDTTLGYDVLREERYRQDFPYIGRPIGTTLRQASGAPIQDISLAWKALTAGTGNDMRFHPYVAITTQKTYEVGGANSGPLVATTVTAVDAIDEFGTVTDSTATTTENGTGSNAGAFKSERLVQIVNNDVASWCLGRPVRTSMINAHSLPSGASVTRVIGTSWDMALCRPTEQQLAPGDSEWQVTQSVEYDELGNVSSEHLTGAGMATRTTNVSWGTRGQFPESVTHALGQTTTLAYRYDLGLPISLADANLLSTQMTYDSLGRATSQSRPDGTRTTWAYLPCAECRPSMRYEVREELLAAGTGSTAHVTRHQYDPFDREVATLTQSVSGAYLKSVRAFDARGRISQWYAPYWDGLPHNGYRELSYDALDRVTADQLYAPSGVLQSTRRYEFEGLVSRMVDPLGHPTTYYSTAWGELIRVVDADLGSTGYQHDPFGLITQITDASGSVVDAFTYTSRGLLTRHANVDRGTWSFTPNALGERIAQVDARGQTLSLFYDALGRVVKRVEPEGETIWIWDSAAGKGIGRLAAVTSPGYGETYRYDALGRVQSVLYAEDQTYEYRLSYNDLGLLDSLTYPAGLANDHLQVRYGYSHGYPDRISDARSGTVFWQLNATDAFGNAVDELLGNGLRVLSGFDPLTGRLESRESGYGGSTDNVQRLRYDWNADGNLRQREDLTHGLTEAFTYDSLHRLVGAALGGMPHLTVSYDAIGNLISKQGTADRSQSATAYAYDEVRRHAVTRAGGAAYSYDANGNMSGRAGGSLSWYSYNLPRSIQSGTLSSQFAYGASRQLWKQVATLADGVQTTIYVGGLMEKVRSPAGKLYRYYIPAGSSTVVYSHGCDGAANTFYITTDHLGSPSSVTCGADVAGCQAGGVFLQEGFGPFGEPTNASWNGPPAAADPVKRARITRRGFTGHEMLDALGLIHLGGRVYDPALARFLSPDPYVADSTSGQAFNRYSYVDNNPLSMIDPSGFLGQGPSDCGRGQRCNVGDVTDPGDPQDNPGIQTLVVRANRISSAGPVWRDFPTHLAVSSSPASMPTVQVWSRQSILVSTQEDDSFESSASSGWGNRLIEAALPVHAFICLFDSGLPGGCDTRTALREGLGFAAGVLPLAHLGEAMAGAAGLAKVLPDAALVARGGGAANQTAARIDAAMAPSLLDGVSGFSAQCSGGTCLAELGQFLRNKELGVTTAGEIRRLGGDVIQTPGLGHHVTVTGLSGEAASTLFRILPNPNPARVP